MSVLHEILSSGKGWAVERATIALQIEEGLQQGAISPAEAKELLEDLVRADKLEAEADDLEVKTMLVTGIYAIIQVC